MATTFVPPTGFLCVELSRPQMAKAVDHLPSPDWYGEVWDDEDFDFGYDELVVGEAILRGVTYLWATPGTLAMTASNLEDTLSTQDFGPTDSRRMSFQATIDRINRVLLGGEAVTRDGNWGN